MRLQLQSPDDLWHLYNVLEEGDIVRAVTHRREEKKTDKLRPERAEKRRVFLGIRVERTEFQEFTDNLRVGGPIVEGPEDMAGMGGHHTFTFAPGDEVTVVKAHWRDHQLRRIAEAVEATRRPQVTFLILDDEGALVAHLLQYGIKPVAEIPFHRGGKMYPDGGSKEDYFQEVLTKVKQALAGETILLLGPGFTREEFRKFVQSRDVTLAARLQSFPTAHTGLQGIQEAMKSGVAAHIFEQSRVAQETRAVEGLLEQIAKDGPQAYGPREVERAAHLGAIETLLITDKQVKAPGGEEIMKRVEATRGKVLIISTHHEAGKKLQSLGGLGALLRFRPP